MTNNCTAMLQYKKSEIQMALQVHNPFVLRNYHTKGNKSTQNFRILRNYYKKDIKNTQPIHILTNYCTKDFENTQVFCILRNYCIKGFESIQPFCIWRNYCIYFLKTKEDTCYHFTAIYRRSWKQCPVLIEVTGLVFLLNPFWEQWFFPGFIFVSLIYLFCPLEQSPVL